MNRKAIRKINFFIGLIIVIGLLSPAQWCKIPIGNTYILWGVAICILYLLPSIIKIFQIPIKSNEYKFIKWFLIWVIIGVIRGCFVASNYWEVKNILMGFLTCCIPIFAYVFYSPQLSSYLYNRWLKYSIPLFFLFYIWTLAPGAYNFYLGPLFVIGCFMPLFRKNKKWFWIIGGLLFMMVFIDIGTRSQSLKSVITLAFSLLCVYHRFISNVVIKFIHWGIYIITITLLVLGISGYFNVFTDFATNKGKYISKKVEHGQIIEEDLSADTRTALYIEVINSAIKNNYVIYGRSLARGNDSVIFGSVLGEDLKTGKFERYRNEFCHPNIFTWLGLIGVILYSLIYLQSSYLAIYKSKSFYLKIIGLFIAFHWAYGWIEDINGFDIQNIALWGAIGIGLSKKFRKMTNIQFKHWINTFLYKI